MFDININRNTALVQLKELIETNLTKKLEYMPEQFNKQQLNALNMFKKRIFLEEVIDSSISFNKSLNWQHHNQNLHLVKTAEELIDVFKLRSDVYHNINYENEFPDTIEGLNFDSYDKDSAILYYKQDKTITGTIKVIFDKPNIKLPSEEKYSFDYLRDKHKQLVELSRFIVSNEKQGLNQEFKYLFSGVYNLFMQNNIDLILSSIKEEHYKMYTKFGGTNIESELPGYGKIDLPFLVMSWNPHNISNFFKRAFLK